MARDEVPRIPGFRIQRRVGAGSRGVVYRAVEERTERIVALKVFNPGRAEEACLPHEIGHERAIGARLRHRNLARIHAFGEYDGRYWLACEYLAGDSLANCIGRGLPAARALAILADLARGLAHAHAQGIVHGDVKPANVLFRGPRCSGAAVLVDFGSARHVQGYGINQGGGTPAYMSPEQRHGQPLDPRSDLYSLGVVLQEMLSGHLHEPGVPAPPLPPAVRWLQPLLDTLMAVDPADRPASAAALPALLADLARAAPEAVGLVGWQEPGVAARIHGIAAPVRHGIRAPSVLLAILLVLLLAFAGHRLLA